MSAHTPGPWSVGIAPSALVIYGDSTMPRTVVARVPNRGYPEQAHGDARLLAAAPALLHAARAAMAYDEAIQRHAAKGEQWVDDGELDKLYEHWVNASAGAIAKATEAS